jgi:uncharacterized OB-fold protein
VSHSISRPVPVPDETSELFWRATAEGTLALARCARCHTFAHPPEPVCPHCHHTDPDFRFESVDGRGVLRSWTVVRQSFLPGFEVPFVLADVELDGTSVRLVGRLLDGPDADLRAGAAVAIAFEPLEGGAAVPAFVLADQ